MRKCLNSIEFANVKKLAIKDLVELKKKMFFVIPGLIVVSMLFILPSIFKPRQSQMILFDKLFDNYAKYYSNISHPDILKILLLDINFPFLLLIPAFLTPLYFTIDSIIGEKESRTLEGLFILPVSDIELLLGKMTTGFLCGVAIAWFLHIFYFVLFFAITSKTIAFHLVSIKWIMISFLIVPTGAFFLNTISVLLSCIVRKVKTAQMWGLIIIVPFYIFFSLISQGSIIVSHLFLILSAVVIMIFNLLLFLVALRLFKRERILLSY